MRSMLAGVAETGSETAKRLEGFASVRSTLAGVAETGSETAERFVSLRSSLLSFISKKSPPERGFLLLLYSRISGKSAVNRNDDAVYKA